MVDITTKQISLRRAVAQGKVLCNAATIERIKNDDLPKGNLLEIAKAAAFLAAKKTPDLLPHCHPISIEEAKVEFAVNKDHVLCTVAIQSIGRTGVEIEALTAASVACLTMVDLLKPIDKELEISELKVLEKTGGKSQLKKLIKGDYSAAVLVCSDRIAAGEAEDHSGQLIAQMLSEHRVDVKEITVVADEAEAIKQRVQGWAENKIDFIFTTGGTGLGPRDVTIEALEPLIEKNASGIAEAMRAFGNDRTPFAMFSRAMAGTIKQSLVVTLPGSTGGVRDGLNAILPGLFHLKAMVAGQGH